MKKLIFLALCFMSMMATAQTSYKLVNGEGYLKSSFTHNPTDTITNAVTKFQYVQIDGYNDIVTVQPTITKVSGTAAATIKLQGSVDNVGYSDIGSAYTVTDVAAQTASFTVAPSNYRYYRLSIVSTGTQVLRIRTPVIVRKKT